MFSLPTENRVWTSCQILLKWTYFRTWNWKQPLFDQMTHNKTKNIVQINQDVKKGQWPGVSTESVHLFLCPSISISLSGVENEDQLVSSFTLLLIFKSCPTGEKPQETQKNKTFVLMRKTNISWIYSFIVSTLIKLILINLFPEILDRDTKKMKSLNSQSLNCIWAWAMSAQSYLSQVCVKQEVDILLALPGREKG